ncbi:ATPase [Stakelama sp. CBK3Z-3]|uniref:ATPase n=1 Tax=Stakelama flava TaxID=2860338 RepID=A0ABS6XMU4_9SPHN|nr:ATP12 family protein [Stakelama flava]MBW4331527.1 ATPase [Stakelama flava]
MKRFWKAVTTAPEGDQFGIALDGRPVRTPGRAPMTVPNAVLAEKIADEWRAVAETIDPAAMPLTGLANAAIDRAGTDRKTFAATLAAYGETDLLCYRADSPDDLVARQEMLWGPHLDWAQARYDIRLERVHGVMHVAQPVATVARLNEAVAACSAHELAGLYPIVTITGSLVLALALLEAAAEADAIWQAANCDEDWQAGQWGEDELAAKARADKRASFDAGVRFLKML